jgi:hypothetical protein
MQPVSKQWIGKHSYNNRVLLEMVYSIWSMQSGYKEILRAVQLVEGWQLRGSSVWEAVKKRVSSKSVAMKRRYVECVIQ